MTQESTLFTAPDRRFTEAHVEADGFCIRYQEAGVGEALVCLHGAGGLRLSHSHALLAEKYRVIALEVPGFGQSPINERSQSMADLALTMFRAVANLGIERFHLMGNSFGGKLALWLAVQRLEYLQSVVLVAPAAIRPEGPPAPPPASHAEQIARLYAHPERLAPMPPPDPVIVAKQQAFVRRIFGPPRDAALESRLAAVNVPVLVLFGTLDRVIPPEMGRLYCEKLPNCHLVLVYDAGHVIDSDRPEAFVAVVDDFLQRHEGFLVNRQSGLIHP